MSSLSSITSSTTSLYSSSSIESMFTNSDSDGDGYLSESEFNASRPGGGKVNSDGTSDDLYSKIDTDGDGKVSESEFESFQTKMQEDGPPPPPPTDETSDASETTQSSLESLFGTADTDGDGTISEDEASAFMEKVQSQVQAWQSQSTSYNASGEGVSSSSKILNVQA